MSFLYHGFLLQSVRILYGRFRESSVDVCFLFTQSSETQHDIVFAVSCICSEFFALQSDKKLVLTAAMPL